MAYRLFLIFFIFSCSVTTNDNNNNTAINNKIIDVPLQYATNFTIKKIGHNTLLTIKQPWKGAQNHFQYLLYPYDKTKPTIYPHATKIPIPVKRIISTSTVDIAFLDFIQSKDNIVALTNGSYVYNHFIRQAHEEGKIKDIGSSGGIDYEKALTCNADMAFVYSIGDRQIYKKFNELNIPAVLLSDFMETHPLGRAEWAVFVACFLGKESIAIDNFKQIAQEYESLKLEAQQYTKSPSVLTGAVYKGTWHVAGGQSLMATFIKDASADYLWSDNQDVSGMPLDFEAVYEKAIDADYWINISYYKNKKTLIESESKYHDFKAFKEGKLFNYYKRASENGGSDIFESAIIYPNLVLKDMIQIFHKDTLNPKDLYYYTQLN
ncbi:MAG: ABC transporter substrate-binding protein [Saprospiraceae bacterium]|nr:ABC transporter substrate-binding protein [Saprospiraceae bacterium]